MPSPDRHCPTAAPLPLPLLSPSLPLRPLLSRHHCRHCGHGHHHPLVIMTVEVTVDMAVVIAVVAVIEVVDSLLPCRPHGHCRRHHLVDVAIVGVVVVWPRPLPRCCSRQCYSYCRVVVTSLWPQSLLLSLKVMVVFVIPSLPWSG